MFRKTGRLALVLAGLGALGPIEAVAAGFTPVRGEMQMAQSFGDTNSRTIVRDRDRDRPRQRYVCVVPDRRGANVCRAGAGRIGGVCRCPGASGSGRLQFD